MISPLGVDASLTALEELSVGDAAQRAALSSKLEQLVYEAQKAFEQYDSVDARNRLAAVELERRWNEKLEEIETTKQRLTSLNGKRYSLSSDEEARIRLMGENFAESWQSDHCPPTLKKMLFRTAIEEIIVRADAQNKTLQLTIHWNGGTHTQVEMERPRSATTYFPFRWMVGTFQEILDSSSGNWVRIKSITDLRVLSFVGSSSEAKYSSTELNFGRLRERGWCIVLRAISIHDF